MKEPDNADRDSALMPNTLESVPGIDTLTVAEAAADEAEIAPLRVKEVEPRVTVTVVVPAIE